MLDLVDGAALRFVWARGRGCVAISGLGEGIRPPPRWKSRAFHLPKAVASARAARDTDGCRCWLDERTDVVTIADTPRKILATETEVERLPLTGQVLAIARETGSSPLAITKAFARLTFGPGKLSFHDYARLRLFDPSFHDGADLARFVGQKRNLAICLAANYRHDWFAVLTNKVTSSTYLSAFGLPSLPIDAVFAARSHHRSANLLQDRADLLRFLGAAENYPLFGKPADGYQSLGSIALAGFDSADRRLICADGSTIAVDDYIAELEANYSDGYIFQRLLQPDPALKAFGCRGLSCVRVVTAATENGPKVIRAAAKITVGSNSADNYWRAGNLLAQLDLSTGALLRATSGLGLALKPVESHPDTGLPLSSMSYPHWPEVLSLALDGAATMRQVPLIGWDIAATENGVKIVEMNATPDFLLVQLADRRGILDDEFKAFLAFQERNKAAHEKEGRRNYSKL